MRATGVRWLSAWLCVGLAACGGPERERGPAPDAGRGDAGARDAGMEGMECDEWPVSAGGEMVVEGLGGPRAIAVDDEYVYWTQGRAVARGGSAIRLPVRYGSALSRAVSALVVAVDGTRTHLPVAHGDLEVAWALVLDREPGGVLSDLKQGRGAEDDSNSVALYFLVGVIVPAKDMREVSELDDSPPALLTIDER